MVVISTPSRSSAKIIRRNRAAGLAGKVAVTIYLGRTDLKIKNTAAGVSMEWSGGRRALAPRGSLGVSAHCIGLRAGAGGCNPDSQSVSVAQPRGATVAFDSSMACRPANSSGWCKISMMRRKSRRLAVISREQPSAYRVRGYLAAKVTKHQTTVSWVWDVFDQDEHRTLRISGEETAKVRHKDAWAAADDAMLDRIAQSSMEQLAAFLTSPEVAPGTAPPPEPQIALRRHERIFARSRRHFPHFPPSGRPDIDGEHRVIRRG